MISSRDVKDLLPEVAHKAAFFIAKCKEAGIDVLVTSTHRDNEAQNALYAQGRTTPGKIITNARGGESFHNYRCALDFVPMLCGKCCWDDAAKFRQCGLIAESLGFEWAGRWQGKLREMAHIQFTNGKSLHDLQKEVK